ncbi:MAG: hypothetical protein KDB65_05240 [Calditrichaeota bacterium]|nr:hypothetical protein [Calditrichota bacterium]MCB9368279.1 hypothetical protein [Calditrichota bacterium]
MRKLPILIALIVLSVAQLSSAESGFKYLKPTTYDQGTSLTIAGKSRHYFVVDADNKVSVTVEGPSQLKIMSRLQLRSEEATPDYSFDVMIEGSKKAKTVHHTSRLSEKAESGSDGPQYLGVLRSKVVDIPSGKHNVSISVPDGSQEVLFIRLSQKTNEFTGGTAVIAMTPFEYTSEVEMVSDEVIYPYYRISSTERAALRLVGPATLKVLSRIEFSPEMKGTQKWKVQVLEDGKLKKAYHLSAGSSDVIQYRNPAPLLPSRAETFFVEIPEGEHVYEFRMEDDSRTVLLRFLMPKAELDGDKRK